jgi:tetratricopeptide (TPR) repeat protein
MGTVELDRDQFDQAMDHFQSALKIQQMYLGPNEINPDLSLTYANIGSVYYKERNQPDGRLRTNLYKNFIDSGMLEKVAFAHSERGEYMKAMHFYSEILELQKRKNESMMNIVATYCCLAELNIKVGRYSDATEYYNLSLDLVENSKNLKDVNVWTVKSDIAVVEYHLGNFEKATKILETAFATQRKSLGKHPRVAKTMYHLGVIKRLQYKRKSALSFLNGSLKIQLSTIGQYHPDTILTQTEIAKVLFDWYEFDESVRKLTAVLRMQYDLLGHEHPDISGTLHLLGVCFSKMNNEKMAIKYFEKCYRMQLKVLDFDCPAVASTKDEIGSIFVQQGKLDKANQLFQDSIRIRRKIGQDHFEVALSLYNMGHYFIARCMYSDALKSFKDSLVIATRTFGADHPFVADIHVGLGTVNTRQCHFNEARQDFQAALEIFENCKLSSNHQRVMNCQERLKRVAHEEDLCV